MFLGVLAALGLFVPRLLHAQNSANADCPMMKSGQPMAMMRDCPMMGGPAVGVQRALEHRDDLGLTADQVTALETLASSIGEKRAETAERMRALHDRLDEATEQERFDETAVQGVLEEIGDARAEIRLVLLRSVHQVRNTLTPEQRDQLAEITDSSAAMSMCMEMMHGQRSRAMKDCPMMGGADETTGETVAPDKGGS